MALPTFDSLWEDVKTTVRGNFSKCHPDHYDGGFSPRPGEEQRRKGVMWILKSTVHEM